VAPTPTTRRAFLQRAVVAAGGLVVGGAVLDACAGRTTPTRAGPAVPITSIPTGTSAPIPSDRLATAETPSGLLRIRNRPGMIGTDTVRAYELATGVTVDYYEDVLDDDLWLASEQQALEDRDDIGLDLAMLGDRSVTELLAAHHLDSLDPDNVPNRTHLRPELAHPGFDPDRARSLPWAAGMAGIAYHTKRVAHRVTGVGDLFDPRYKGRVTMLADPRDGLGMVMAWQGSSPADATLATVTRAVNRVHIEVERGQIARFTGNADFADLVSGKMVMAQVRSGDVAGLRAANPYLAFVVPAQGSTLFARNMVVPDTSRNQVAAESWMNWIYDRPNYAAMIAQVRATAVLSDLDDDLARIRPALAADPLVNPPPSTWRRLAVWAPLDPTTEARYAGLYAAVTR
jgi:spermidine/putrescine transport system substrate-binding protein